MAFESNLDQSETPLVLDFPDDHLDAVAGPVVEEVDVAGQRHRDQLVAGTAGGKRIG